MKLAPVVDIIVATGTCLMLGYGARLVIAGQLTAGALVVFLLYLGKMYKPMRDLSKMADTVSKASVGFERIREVLETESGVRDLRHARRAAAFKGAIEFDHVSFGYSPDQVILEDVSFTVAPGQVAAFVGPTGGGKTTIINLSRASTTRCPGPSRSTERISADSRFDRCAIRSALCCRTRCSSTRRSGRTSPTAGRKRRRAEIVRAAELANAHEFITEMPDGYDTMVGERGVTLSGGQRQRIAIARAVIRDTPILVLDEPTSGLDAQSEQSVFEALERLMKGKTSIVIAHHLETILHADAIFVVKDRSPDRAWHPRRAAGGRGFYAELYGIQSGEPVMQLGELCISARSVGRVRFRTDSWKWEGENQASRLEME